MDKHAVIKLKEQGLSNRKAAEILGINRKTVGRYWNKYVEELEQLKERDIDVKEIQESLIAEPKYDSSTRRKRKYTEKMDQALNEILDSERIKSSLLGPNKQQLTNQQIYNEIISRGFEIGISTISNEIRKKRNRSKECFIKQQYNYGDRLEYDFGEVKLLINDVLTKYHIAVFSSPASNFRWAYLYKNQQKDVFLDSHVKFFEMVGGVYREVVYDNMRNVVSRFIGRNEKILNDDLLKMSLYYGFDINVTNCFKGNEKGHVEGSVKIIRNKIFGPRYKFTSYEAASSYLEKNLVLLNGSSEIAEEKETLLEKKHPLN